jgi:hypothetical protein
VRCEGRVCSDLGAGSGVGRGQVKKIESNLRRPGHSYGSVYTVTVTLTTVVVPLAA